MGTHHQISQSADAIAQSMRVAAKSHIGMRRRVNQDSYTVIMADGLDSWRRDGHFLVVADGMGAHAAGEKASQMATKGISHTYHKLIEVLPAERLHRAMNEANADIYRTGQASEAFRSMGTTASSLLILPEGAVCGHVGDSRIYRLRGNRFEQLTFDHSLVWEMQEVSQQYEDSMQPSGIPKNIITRSLGPNPTVLVDLEGPFPVQIGDRFLLCSDGLSGQLTNAELGVLMQLLTPEEAVDAMIDLANLRGGPDNVTAICAEIADERIVTQPAVAKKTDDNTTRFSRLFAITAVVCLLVTWGLIYYDQVALAIVTAILAVVAAAGFLARAMQAPESSGQILRYGKAPYRSMTVAATEEMFNQFFAIFNELREVGQERLWGIDWDRWEGPGSEISVHAENQRWADAVRLTALAISEVVRQIPPNDIDEFDTVF